MKRHRLRLALLTTAFAAFAVEVYLLAPDRNRNPAPIYRQAGYDGICPGMSLGEVESLLGTDRGAVREGYTCVDQNIGPRAGCRGSTWLGADMVVQVWFDDTSGMVVDKEFRPVIRVPSSQPSLLFRLRRWLGL
jgi:hypothetical protein